jgi:hypothetical protein
LTRACHGGDWLACIPQVGLEPAKAVAACNGGAPAACLAATWGHFNNQSGAKEANDEALRERACSGGVLEACIESVSLPRASHDSPPQNALQAVRTACDRGDADACAALGHPIAASELCLAHDFKACGSDNGDLVTGCDHGVAEACGKLAIAARDADPPDPLVIERFARACNLNAVVDGVDLCRMNRPADLAIGCAAYQPRGIPAISRRKLPAIPGAANHAFLLAGIGRQAPSAIAETARRLGSDVSLYVIAPPDVASQLAPATSVTLDASLADATPALLTTPDPGNPLGYPIGKGWPVVVDATGTSRAVLSFEFGIVPVTLARCVNALLSEP